MAFFASFASFADRSLSFTGTVMANQDHTPSAIQHHTPTAPLRLASGALLHGATVGYQTWGNLNAARDNVVWVCHALTASSDVESWWPGAFGPGRLLDPTRH